MIRTVLMAGAAVFMAPIAVHAEENRHEELSIKPIPIVSGDFLDFAFDPDDSAWKWSGKDERNAVQAIELDLHGERLWFGYRGSTKLFATLWVRDPERTKGPRPGWKVAQSYPINDAKPDKTNFTGFFSEDPGHYRLELSPANSETKGWAKVWFFTKFSDVFEPNEINGDGSPKKDAMYEGWLEASRRPLDPAMAAPNRRRVVPAPRGALLLLPVEGEPFVATAPDALKPYYSELFSGGERNAVLNFEKLGLAAMEAGEFSIAEYAFDSAIDRIETIFSKSETAAAARSKWAAEAVKDFKGEPYERAMAYYYRGLLYLRVGDYENARAVFKGAGYQDTLSEAEEYQSDFALMDFLEGWASSCAGDSGSAVEAFARAESVNANLKMPDPSERILVLAELGRGPVKDARGNANQLLSFADSEDRDADATATLVFESGTIEALEQAESITFQATTRGGRPVDVILNGKTQFKETTGLIGDLAYGALGINPLMAVPTMLFAALSGRTRTTADVRMWDTLPDHIGVSTLPKSKAGNVQFRYNSNTSTVVSDPWINGGDDHCTIIWGRGRSALAGGAGVPGENAASAKKSAERQAELDASFRQSLLAL